MKRITFFLTVLIAIHFKMYGQAPKNNPPDSWLYIAIYAPGQKPLLVRQFIVSDNDVQSHAIAARPGSLSRYGKLNVMEMYLKPNVKLKTMNDVFNKFHINDANRILPIMIDTSYIYNYPLNTIMAAGNGVKSVNIQVDSATKQRYLNINTGNRRIKISNNYIN